MGSIRVRKAGSVSQFATLIAETGFEAPLLLDGLRPTVQQNFRRSW